MKFAFLMVLIPFCFISSNAQESRLRPLHKGDTLPDLKVSISLGDSSYVGHLSDYKGKLIILDFWATYCVSCVQTLPEMLAFQKEFADRIQIIIVTPNSQEQIDKLWREWGEDSGADSLRLAAQQLPFITQDSVLDALFPHMAIPTHAWIDPDQVVQAIAYNSTTNSENISKMLAKEEVSLEEERYIEVDVKNPLAWISGDVLKYANIRYYSLLLDYLECGGFFSLPRTKDDSITGDVNGVVAMNSSLHSLYEFAYHKKMNLLFVPFKRMIFKTKYKNEFQPPKDYVQFIKWAKANTYCYALKVNEGLSDKFYALMQSDLDRLFHFRSRIVKTKTKCLLLKRISLVDKINSKGGPEVYNINAGILSIRNLDSEQLFLSLNSIFENLFPQGYFFNSSIYKGKIDIDIPYRQPLNTMTLYELRKSLRKFGFDIVYGYRNIDMLEIDDEK